nr:PBP1A family penicillin-binding protein [Ramlibacter sp.]
MGVVAGLAVSAALVIGVSAVMVYPELPDVASLADYHPKLPLRVLASDGTLLGEFGEERRTMTPIHEIPAVMKNAVLSIEDARFYQHGGVDYQGMLRASLANLAHARSQGASTITMQVARNVYLSSEKTFTRKLYEVLLTYKLEQRLTKDQILEIYMNQIYLGNRAYGFAAACETYFGKPLKDITVAEAAMLAGLPKAPSAYNPVVNPTRARTRQMYIIGRMENAGFITQDQAEAARRQPLHVRSGHDDQVHAAYVAEMVRQLVYAQYGDQTYTRGIDVHTTINAADQEAAYRALRKGIMQYEQRTSWRGPEDFVDLPADAGSLDDAIDDALSQHPDNGDVLAAVVLAASPRKVTAVRGNGERIEITRDGLDAARSGLSDKATARRMVRRGAIVRVLKTPKNTWALTQLPEVEGALVALDPHDGSIRAMVGGFDFDQNKFNHATQAWRQPGSGFKPFIYSAALEQGISGATVVNDGPLATDPPDNGGQAWQPHSHGSAEGSIAVHTGLATSNNAVAVRILEAVGIEKARDWITRFGFDKDKHPPYPTLALGAGSVTPMQMAAGYAVFANGGYRVDPRLVTRITDARGKDLVASPAAPLDESRRAISPRNAFVMDTLLQEVAREGTAARVQKELQRPDLYGKTGTTNDSVDSWFNGFQPDLVATVWVGYDTPKSLGERETGASVSVPIWIDFMRTALKGTAQKEPPVPGGVVQENGSWTYEEFTGGRGVASVGLPTATAPAAGDAN